MTYIRFFWDDESGAITVDWVVLSAAVIGLGLLVVGTVRQAAMNPTSGLGATVGSVEVDTSMSQPSDES